MLEAYQRMGPRERAAARRVLAKWAADMSSDSWRARAALRLAVTAGLRAVVDAASRAILARPSAVSISHQLAVVAAITRLPTPVGLTYLQSAAAGSPTSSDPDVRKLALRADIALAFLGTGEARAAGLRRALRRAAQWGDEAAYLSAVGFVEALRQRDPDFAGDAHLA
jgi:hypothetical protein